MISCNLGRRFLHPEDGNGIRREGVLEIGSNAADDALPGHDILRLLEAVGRQGIIGCHHQRLRFRLQFSSPLEFESGGTLHLTKDEVLP